MISKMRPHSSPYSMHSGKRTQLVVSVLCIIIVGLWAYHNSFGGAFVFDDLPRILENSHIRHLWPIWGVLRASSRPLVEISLAINYALGGTQVFGYHVVNLLIHLCAAIVFFDVVRRTFCTESLRDRYGEVSCGLALAIALLWVVHPLQTESVTYVIQRAESMMGLCYLLTLYCVIRGVTSDSWRGWYVVAIMACAAGMASKPIMVTAPLLVLLYDRTFIAGSFRQALIQRKVLYVGLAITWGLLAALLALAPPDIGAGFSIHISPLTYARTQPGVLLHYLKLSLWPKSLCLDYGPLDYLAEARLMTEIIAPMLVIGALGALTIWTMCAQRRIGFLGAWFFLILAPTSSFFPIRDYAVEHRMYLSLAAVIGLVVLGGYNFLQVALASKQRLRRITMIACVTILVVLLGLTTIQRNQDYSSDETIWRDTISKNPQNAGAHNNLGALLAQQGHFEEAKSHFIQALQIDPNYPNANNHLGALLAQEGHLEEAMGHFIRALQFNPTYADAHDSLGVIAIMQGHIEEAKNHFIRALQLDPDYTDAHKHLGALLDQQGHLEEAKSHFIQALELDPNDANSHNHLGALLAQQGHLEEAKVHFIRALQLNPDLIQAKNNLDSILKQLQEGP